MHINRRTKNSASAACFVIGKCCKRHRAAELLDFLKQIGARALSSLDVLIVMGDYTPTNRTDPGMSYLQTALPCLLRTDLDILHHLNRGPVRWTYQQATVLFHNAVCRVRTSAHIERHDVSPKPYR